MFLISDGIDSSSTQCCIGNMMMNMMVVIKSRCLSVKITGCEASPRFAFSQDLDVDVVGFGI